MVATAEAINQLSIQVVKSIEIDAPLEVSFEELLEQMDPANVTPDGTPMPMKMEPWPGDVGFGIWVKKMGISGDTSRRSRDQGFLRSLARSLCPTRPFPMYSFDWYRVRLAL